LIPLRDAGHLTPLDDAALQKLDEAIAGLIPASVQAQFDSGAASD
jgi:hypothetical protein